MSWTFFSEKNYGFLLDFAVLYQMNEVMHKCDLFLSHAQAVKFMQKLLLIDKYGLPETKKACLTSRWLQKRVFIQDLEMKPEYTEISDKLKIELLEKSINSFIGIMVCRHCERACGGYCSDCDDGEMVIQI